MLPTYKTPSTDFDHEALASVLKYLPLNAHTHTLLPFLAPKGVDRVLSLPQPSNTNTPKDGRLSMAAMPRLDLHSRYAVIAPPNSKTPTNADFVSLFVDYRSKAVRVMVTHSAKDITSYDTPTLGHVVEVLDVYSRPFTPVTALHLPQGLLRDLANGMNSAVYGHHVSTGKELTDIQVQRFILDNVPDSAMAECISGHYPKDDYLFSAVNLFSVNATIESTLRKQG